MTLDIQSLSLPELRAITAEDAKDFTAREWEALFIRIRALEREEYERTGVCRHTSTQADNYGESCAICHEQLRGYGYGGFFGSNLRGNERCIHEFSNGICMFCETAQPITHETHSLQR